MLSDDSTSDSDTGRRFKTDSTRRPAANNDTSLTKHSNRKESDGRYKDRSSSFLQRNRSNDRSSARSRDRSPLRHSKHDRNHRSRHSDPKLKNKEDSEHRSYRDTSSGKSRNEKNDTHKLDSNKSEYCSKNSSKTDKQESDILKIEEQKSHRNEDVKDKITRLRNNEEVVSNIKNVITRHLSQPSKIDKKDEKTNPKVAFLIKDRESKRDEGSDLILEQNKINDTYKLELEMSHNSNVGQVGAKLVDENEKLMSASNSENLTKKQILLSKQRKKKDRDRKKSKHRRKNRKNHLKSGKKDNNTKSNDKFPTTNDLSASLSTGLNSNSESQVKSNRRNSSESNEEGEIISDSDEDCNNIPTSTKNAGKYDTNMFQMADLREKLSSKSCRNDVLHMLSFPLHVRETSLIDSSYGEVEGPALPPHMQSTDRRNMNIGPVITENMRKTLENAFDHYSRKHDSEGSEIMEDYGVIGPLPVDSKEKWSTAHTHLEERALKLKIDSLSEHSSRNPQTVREEWMERLPEGRGSLFGLTARHFRAHEYPDLTDRSVWTDTPQEKALKAEGIIKYETDSRKLQRDAELQYIQQYEEQQESVIKKHKKKHKRDISLLELHQKKIKKKKDKDDKKKSERRPFNRDIDLKTNRFDEAQKKAIYRKAQLLDDRFSRGESKFL